MNKLVCLGSSALLASTASALFQWQGCPKDYKPQATFDKERYLGNWFEVVADWQIPFELFSDCVLVNYTEREDGSVNVLNRAYSLFYKNGLNEIKGNAVQTDAGDASLRVSFFGGPAKSTDRSNYTIMDTDYDNYSIVYTCNDLFGGRASFDILWILSREPTIPYESL